MLSEKGAVAYELKTEADRLPELEALHAIMQSATVCLLARYLATQ